MITKKIFQMTGRKESSSSCLRKVTLETVMTGVGLHFSLLPARSSVASYYNAFLSYHRRHIIRQEQARFRRGKSCIDHIFILRQILE